MKNSEIKGLTMEELRNKIQQVQDTSSKLKMMHSISALDNPIEIRTTRRDLARLKTEMSFRNRTQ